MRTFSREDWQASEHAWQDGEYGWRWGQLRRIARESGILYPPAGTAHDDRDAESPSQRAIIWRALEDNPTELYAIVRRARSWSGVVDRIIGLESRLRSDADYNQRDIDHEKANDPDHRESASSIASILQRIGDS